MNAVLLCFFSRTRYLLVAFILWGLTGCHSEVNRHANLQSVEFNDTDKLYSVALILKEHEDRQLSSDLNIHNKTGKILVLSSVKKSCSCLIEPEGADIILSGERETMHFHYEPFTESKHNDIRQEAILLEYTGGYILRVQIQMP